jgi:hypothetical protein
MKKSNKVVELHQARRRFKNQTDLTPAATKDVAAAMNLILADVRALSEDEELPLAYERPAFPRLPLAAR